MRALFRFAAIAATLAVACPLAAQLGSKTGNIIGQIRIQGRGSPDRRLIVHIAARGMPMTDGYADDEGKFGFNNLPTNPYTITIDDPGFEVATVTTVVNPDVSHINMVTLTLTPKRTAAPDNPAVIKGSNPNIVDMAALARDYPKGAFKAYEQGLKKAQEGKLEEAATLFAKALGIAPAMYVARNNLGLVYIQQQKFGPAEEQFKTVIAAQKADANSYFNLANVYLLTDRPAEGLQAVQEGLKREPGSGFGQFLLGTFYSRQGNVEAAEKQLNRALQTDPSLSRVHLELANLYLRARMKDRAVKQLTTFLHDYPKDPMVPQAKQVLERLRTTPD